MRDDFALIIALSGGLLSAVAAAVLIATPAAVPLLVLSGIGLGASIRELADRSIFAN